MGWAMVLIASAAEKVRRRWIRVLQGTFPIHEVSERAALEQTLACQKPSVLLLDLGLPQLGGIAGVCAIQRLSPSTKIILLTNVPNDEEEMRALKAGVKGYCNRDTGPLLLRKAVDVVGKGEIWIERKVVSHLLEELTSATEGQQIDAPLQPDNLLDCLTSRERQVAQLVGGGLCNKDIANHLNISERTVKAYLTSIFRKLNISDRLHLALLIVNYNRIKR